MRRRIFGRSHDSSASAGKEKDGSSRHSKDSGALASPALSIGGDKEASANGTTPGNGIAPTTGGRHARAKKSLDGGKGNERLSIFGGFGTGSLGKSRKPAPRYSA